MAYQSARIDAVQALAFLGLKPHSAAEITRVGVEVQTAVDQFCSDHPEEFQPPPPQGLLGSDPGPRSDFEVARSVELMPTMLTIAERGNGVPPLLAYIAVASLESPLGRYFDEGAALDFLVFRSLAETKKTRDEIAVLKPLAEHGQKFAVNRKVGHLGPVAKTIKAFMVKQPDATAVQVWNALKARPPKGYAFMENRQGKYIEKGPKTVMQWDRFANLVSEHRPKN